MQKKWRHVYSYSEIIHIYVYWTNRESQKSLLWTQLLQFCPDSFETNFHLHIVSYLLWIDFWKFNEPSAYSKRIFFIEKWLICQRGKSKNSVCMEAKHMATTWKQVKKVITSVTIAIRTLKLSVLPLAYKNNEGWENSIVNILMILIQLL